MRISGMTVTYGASDTEMNQNRPGNVMPAVRRRIRRRTFHVGKEETGRLSGGGEMCVLSANIRPLQIARGESLDVRVRYKKCTGNIMEKNEWTV